MKAWRRIAERTLNLTALGRTYSLYAYFGTRNFNCPRGVYFVRCNRLATRHPAAPDGGVTTDSRVPRSTPLTFASDEKGIRVRLPAGLYYCPIPSDWVGSDHGRAFYIVAPIACPATQGYVLSRVAEPVPTLEIYYGYDIGHDYNDGRGDREADSDHEIAEQSCPKPSALTGAVLLGRQAIGCRIQNGNDLSIVATAIYEPEHMVGHAPLRGELVMSLSTTRGRLAKDWPIFVAFLAGAAQCTPAWEIRGWTVAPIAARHDEPTAPQCPAAFWRTNERISIRVRATGR